MGIYKELRTMRVAANTNPVESGHGRDAE